MDILDKKPELDRALLLVAREGVFYYENINIIIINIFILHINYTFVWVSAKSIISFNLDNVQLSPLVRSINLSYGNPNNKFLYITVF